MARRRDPLTYSRVEELREHMHLRAQYFANGGIVTRYPKGFINPKRDPDESIAQFARRQYVLRYGAQGRRRR